MSIEQSLYAHLADTTAITDLVGTRIRPGFAGHADTFPYLTYGLQNRERDDASGGQQATLVSTFAIDVFGDSDSSKNGYLEAVDVADAVRDVLNGLNGTLGDGTTNEDAKLRLVDEFDVDVGLIAGEFAAPFQRRQVYTIKHRETVPTNP